MTGFLYQLLGEVTKTDIKKGTARAIDAFMAAIDDFPHGHIQNENRIEHIVEDRFKLLQA